MQQRARKRRDVADGRITLAMAAHREAWLAVLRKMASSSGLRGATTTELSYRSRRVQSGCIGWRGRATTQKRLPARRATCITATGFPCADKSSPASSSVPGHGARCVYIRRNWQALETLSAGIYASDRARTVNNRPAPGYDPRWNPLGVLSRTGSERCFSCRHRESARGQC